MFKFWVFVFKRTGFVHSSIKVAEYRHIRSKLPEIEKIYLRNINDPDEGYSLKNLIGMEIGLYQTSIGLTIWSKHMVWSFDPWYTKVITITRRFLGV